MYRGGRGGQIQLLPLNRPNTFFNDCLRRLVSRLYTFPCIFKTNIAIAIFMKLPMLAAKIISFHIKNKELHSCTYFEGAVTLKVHMFKNRVLLGPYSEFNK